VAGEAGEAAQGRFVSSKVESTQTVRAALFSATAKLHSLPRGRRDAELLLMGVVGRDRAWLMTHGDAELSAEQISQFENWVARRARQEPVQYILGETEFYGLRMRVTPAVLIPRPETEHLVEAVLARVGRDSVVRICDVGTGSGAIAVALAQALPRARVTALDISRAALDVARGNAERLGVAGRIRFVESDLLRAVRGERFEVVVSNPPYVAEGEVLEAQVREYEPREALFAGPTGLEVYRRLIPEAWEALHPIRANDGAMGTPALVPGGLMKESLCEEKSVPQGLKPDTSSAGYGTAEAVPLQRNHGTREAMPHERNYGTPEAMPHERNYGTPEAMPLQRNHGTREAMPHERNYGTPEAMPHERNHGTPEAVPLERSQVLAQAGGGWLLMEIGRGQRDALKDLLTGWNGVEFVADLQGIPRVAIAQRRA
jgi:release factor glutamine methyltransferase